MSTSDDPQNDFLWATYNSRHPMIQTAYALNLKAGGLRGDVEMYDDDEDVSIKNVNKEIQLKCIWIWLIIPVCNHEN